MPIQFKKFPSIEQSYNQKYVSRYRNTALKTVGCDIDKIKYIIEEKIDGGNFAIYVTADEVKYARRKDFLEEDESFFDYKNVMNKYSNDIEKIQEYVKKLFMPGVCLILYGEIFGSGIQGGVSYQEEKRILLFQAAIQNGDHTEWYCSEETKDLLENIGIPHLLVPHFEIVRGIEEALNFNVNDKKTLIGDPNFNPDNKIIEGVVIKPYHVAIPTDTGSPFLIKKKSDKYCEKEKVKKYKAPTPMEPATKELRDIFLSYINENRANSAYSKEGGPIEEHREIGKFLKIILEDAKEDFLKENQEAFSQLDEKQQRKVFNGSGEKITSILIAQITKGS